MRLHEVMPDAPTEARELDVTGVAYDTRQVAPGTLFFCVPGFTRDGHDFAPEAIARGAVALVVQRPLELEVPEVLVPDVRASMAPAVTSLKADGLPCGHTLMLFCGCASPSGPLSEFA